MQSAKPWEAVHAAAGHLEFYAENNISPVSQDIRDLDAHLDRRRSLYRSLGLLPAHFRRSSVLEIGPGSGHNSLYIASCQPDRYALVEPNPTAVVEIGKLYDGFPRPHTRPQLHASTLQDFQTEARFDVCISEGWLGSARHEHEMLAKLAGFVAPGGVIVVTTVSPVGIIPNVLRKLLSQRLIAGITGLQAQTEHLLAAWGPHLATMPFMSRPHPDWIQDNMLNPAYYGVCLIPQMVHETIGSAFTFYNCSPRITTDWRWYKLLHSEHKDFNNQFLESYYQQVHNFIDHRQLLPLRAADENRALEHKAWTLLQAANDWEKAGCRDLAPVVVAMRAVVADIRRFSGDIADALDEGLALLVQDRPSVAEAAALPRFKPLFGREMVYVSLVRDEV